MRVETERAVAELVNSYLVAPKGSPDSETVMKILVGARLLRAAGPEGLARRWISDATRRFTVEIERGAISEDDRRRIADALNELRALVSVSRANWTDAVGVGAAASVRAALRPVAHTQLREALDPARAEPADVAPLMNAHAQTFGRAPFLSAEDGELLGRLMRLDPDALLTVSANVTSLRNDHTPMDVALDGETSVKRLLREARTVLMLRSGGRPLPDGIGAPGLPVPVATDPDDAKRRLAGLLDNTFSGAHFDPDTIPTATVAVSRSTLDEFIAMGYRPVLVEQVPSLGGIDGHALEGIDPLPDGLPPGADGTAAAYARTAREPRWHLGAIAHYEKLAMRDKPGRAGAANALVILTGAPAAQGDLGEDVPRGEVFVWPRAALTDQSDLYGPARPASELSVRCSHENTRWLPGRALLRADTTILCCVDCQRRGFASVPTHRLPDGHPQLDALLGAPRGFQCSYVEGERALRHIAGDPPPPPRVSLRQLRASEGLTDLDALAAAAFSPARAARRRTMRTALGH